MLIQGQLEYTIYEGILRKRWPVHTADPRRFPTVFTSQCVRRRILTFRFSRSTPLRLFDCSSKLGMDRKAAGECVDSAAVINCLASTCALESGVKSVSTEEKTQRIQEALKKRRCHRQTDGETRELSSVNLMEVPHYTCSKALLRESLSWMWNVREKEGAAVQSIQSQRATEQAQNVLAAGLIP